MVAYQHGGTPMVAHGEERRKKKASVHQKWEQQECGESRQYKGTMMLLIGNARRMGRLNRKSASSVW